MRSASSLPRLLTATLSLLALVAAARADGGPSNAKLNTPIDNVRLGDPPGKTLALHDFRGKKAVVVVCLSFDCPVCVSYAGPLADMARSYAERGVAFVGLDTADDTDAAAAARHAREYGIPFPVFADPAHRAAAAFQADITPEAFVLDHNFVLRYRGRIDDGYAARLKRRPAVRHHDLLQALDEVLAGKDVSVPVTQAVGCRVRREAPPVKTAGTVTYYRDVLPILQQSCQTCHRPGEVGPFSLMTYREAVNWASDVKDYTESRKMPPWKPVAGPAFHNERRLNGKQIATLAAWVDGGTPEGDPKDAPPPRHFTEGWQLGTPDLVLTPADDFHVGPSGKDIFRCFVLPTHLPEDRYVTAVELRPGNPRVVHHSLLFIDGTGQARKLEQRAQEDRKADDVDRGPGYSVSMGIGFLPQGGLGGWAPGAVPRFLPAGTGYFLPKGADVVMQVHYHRDGRAEKDRPRLGLYFAKGPVHKRFQSMTIAGRTVGKPPFAGFPNFFIVPAGDDHYPLHGGIEVEQDCTLHSVMPHMHLLGKAIKVTLRPKEGPPETLVAIKDWDYNWQETYFFKEPIHVKAGTRVEVDAVYDNSAANPNNPNDPPRRVTFGEQTTNEMCFVFLGAAADKPGRLRGRQLKPDDAKK
ncbi:MAG TPA: redoxin domain-containing protein [Gemmataceae bacterium]|nr:redoxin domain-containing protein [Gemmataceae bacterium]